MVMIPKTKRALSCRESRNFRVINGQLQHKRSPTKLDFTDGMQQPETWKVVLQTKREREAVMKEPHSGTLCKHLYHHVDIIWYAWMSHTYNLSTRKLYACEFCFVGGHLGRDQTRHKIAQWYFWLNMTKDIRSFLKKCDRCQQVNSKQKDVGSVLHPILVETAVAWHKVNAVLF